MGRRLVDVRSGFLGRRVVLFEETWYGHVLDEHPELACTEIFDDIRRVIADPTTIADAKHPRETRRCFYGPAPYGFRPTELLKVVVAVKLRLAVVVSCHLVTCVSPKEVVLWPT